MSIVLQGPFEPVVAVWTWERAVKGRAIDLPDRFAALGWLRRVAAGAGAMATLRRLIAAQQGFAAHRLDDGEALDWLADQIASGRLKLVARPAAARGPLTARGEGQDEDEAIAPTSSSARSPAKELTWITIELLGEDDRPITGARYHLELPDGSVREGRLDGQGLARVRGIEEAGDCTVTFPDLDEEAWTTLGTTSVP